MKKKELFRLLRGIVSINILFIFSLLFLSSIFSFIKFYIILPNIYENKDAQILKELSFWVSFEIYLSISIPIIIIILTYFLINKIYSKIQKTISIITTVVMCLFCFKPVLVLNWSIVNLNLFVALFIEIIVFISVLTLIKFIKKRG